LGGVAFTPPDQFVDVSEYVFVADQTRRVTITPTGTTVANEDLLPAVAGAYARQLADLFGVHAEVSSVRIRPEDSAVFVTVTARYSERLPGQGEAQVVERSAFLRLPSGLTVRLTVTAPANDRVAEADFERLVSTARRNEAGPVRYALPFKADTTATGPQRIVGPLLLELPAGYREITEGLTFRLPDATQEFRVQLEGAPSHARPASGAESFSVESEFQLFEATATAKDEWGRSFAYEVVSATTPETEAGTAFSTPGEQPGADLTAAQTREFGEWRLVVRARATEAKANSDLKGLVRNLVENARPAGDR
jgi:hypothetical protein